MGALAQFLISAFSGLVAYFTGTITKKIALVVFAVAFISTISFGLYTLIKSLISGLVYTISNEWILMGMGILWSSNADACITAILTAEVAVYVYRLKKSVYQASMSK